MPFGKKGKVHAIYEDGHHIIFSWNGWPENIDPVWDTPEIEEDQRRFRLTHLAALADKVAGPSYKNVNIRDVWIENNGESYYALDLLDKLDGVQING